MDFWTDFAQHYTDLYRFAYRLLGRSTAAEDVVQETFLRAARNHAKLLEGEPARRWLFVVARNLCVSHMRHAARHPEVPLDAGPETRSQWPNPAEAVDASERAGFVKDAVAQLPPAMREVVVLREYEGMDYAQIADIVGCSLGTVKSRLARARAQLRERLEPMLED